MICATAMSTGAYMKNERVLALTAKIAKPLSFFKYTMLEQEGQESSRDLGLLN
jgi:hypothetical protein